MLFLTMTTASHFFNLLLISSLSFPLQCSPAITGFRVELTRLDATTNFTILQLVQRAVHRSKYRSTTLISMPTTQFQAPIHPGEGEYLVNLAIGTPPIPFTVILDTGSDLTWTQCNPCEQCFSQPTPLFSPSHSSTFSNISCTNHSCSALVNLRYCENTCMYRYPYTDRSYTRGLLASETLTFNDNIRIPNIVFGCGLSNQMVVPQQSSGVLGLGRGDLSLVSQLSIEKFSYCLTSFQSSTKSSLFFGALADLIGRDKVKSTPILRNPNRSYFYYLNLKGITVGETLINITTTQIQSDGGGGLIIDSGTFMTYLEEDVYEQVKNVFLSEIKLSMADGSGLGLDLCYTLPRRAPLNNIGVPGLVFHFEGADLDLPLENYFLVESDSSLLCLMISGSNEMSVFGNFQQQNMHVVYDLKNAKLGFVQAQCDQL